MVRMWPKRSCLIGNCLEMTWSLQHKSQMFAWWKNDLFFGCGRDQNGGEKINREGRLEVAKTDSDFFGRGRDQFGPKKLVVTFLQLQWGLNWQQSRTQTKTRHWMNMICRQDFRALQHVFLIPQKAPRLTEWLQHNQEVTTISLTCWRWIQHQTNRQRKNPFLHWMFWPLVQTHPPNHEKHERQVQSPLVEIVHPVTCSPTSERSSKLPTPFGHHMRQTSCLVAGQD